MLSERMPALTNTSRERPSSGCRSSVAGSQLQKKKVRINETTQNFDEQQTFASPLSESFKRNQTMGSPGSETPKSPCDPNKLYIVTRKLRSLARELST